MQVKLVRYERLVAQGQFENHRGVVEIEVQEGDDPNAVFNFAKQFIDYHLGVPAPVPHPVGSYPPQPQG